MSSAARTRRLKALDAKLLGALEVLAPKEKLRLGAFRLFSRLLALPPEVSFFKALRGSGAVRELTALAWLDRSEAAPSLTAFDEWLTRADTTAFEDARRDYLDAFVAARHLPAPPWESVYRSPDRLVFQEPAREVLLAYLAAGFGFDGMRQTPADHISLELAFAATLLAEAATSVGARGQLDRFEAEHMASWMPSFCANLGEVAKTPPYVAVATALPRLLARSTVSPGVTQASSQT